MVTASKDHATADPRMPSLRSVKWVRRWALALAWFSSLVTPVWIDQLSGDAQSLGLGTAALVAASVWSVNRLTDLIESYPLAVLCEDVVDPWLDIYGRSRVLAFLPPIVYALAVASAQLFDGKNTAQSFSSLVALLGFAALADLVGGQYKDHRAVITRLQNGWLARHGRFSATCLLLLALGVAIAQNAPSDAVLEH